MGLLARVLVASLFGLHIGALEILPFETPAENWKSPRHFVVVREQLQTTKPAVGRKLIDLPGYVFRVFVTNRSDAALEIWRDYNGRAAVECRIDELKNELAADHFCLRSFFATRVGFPGCAL